MKKLRPLLVVVALLAVLAAIGARVRNTLQPKKVVPRTVTARLGSIVVKVSETGTIEPVNKVDVKSKVAGRLLSIPIQEGQFVKQGQMIATVDRTLIDPQIARAEAQLISAQARLQQSEAQYRLQQSSSRMAIAQARVGLETAQANVTTAQVSLKTAQARLATVLAGTRPQEMAQQQQAVSRAQITLDDAHRTQKRRLALYEKGFVSQSDTDQSQVSVDIAESNLAAARQQMALLQAGPRAQEVDEARIGVESARAQLASSRTQVNSARIALAKAQADQLENDVSRSNVVQARASVSQSANDLAQLRVNVADTSIIAPASGIVLKKYKEPTEIVQSATTGFSDTQSIVATLGNKPMVRVGINEVDIARVRPRSAVDIRVDAVPDTVFHGVVTSIAPASTNAFTDSGASAGGGGAISKFSVKIAFNGYDPRLRPGMSASVDIISQQHKNAVLVPLEAVPGTGKTAAITVLEPNGKQDKKTVTVGLRNDTNAEILSGVKPGDRLVVTPVDGKDRRKINISGPN